MGREPPVVAVFVQIPRVVQRNGFDEDADDSAPPSRLPRRTRAASRRRRRAAPARRSRRRGCRGARRSSCRCGSVRRTPSGMRSRPRGRPSDCGIAGWRRIAASRPRRESGRRRRAGRRGTGSPGWGSSPTPPHRARDRGWPARRAGCRTRAPNSSCSSRPRVTPYTPPLRATSSPKISASGWRCRTSCSARLMASATVSGESSCGSVGRHRTRRDGDGFVEAVRSGVITVHGLSSCASSVTSPASSMTSARLASYRSSTSEGVE